LQQNFGKPPWRGLVQRCLALLAPAARLDAGSSCNSGNGIAKPDGFVLAYVHVISCFLVQHLQLPQSKVAGGEPAAA
jgi:hypothetical protein